MSKEEEKILEDLLYYLQSCKEGTDLSEKEIFGYDFCITDVKEYFEERLGK